MFKKNSDKIIPLEYLARGINFSGRMSMISLTGVCVFRTIYKTIVASS
jgi:hypothetical protein